MTSPPPAKTVLITGCSRGSIGDALAQEFLRRKFHVVATARCLSRLSHLRALGVQTEELEVTSQESITALAAKISSLDILFNNAGQGYGNMFSDSPLSDVRSQFETNFYPIFTVSQAFLPLLIKSRGIIVNHGSVASQSNFAGRGVYAATKAAMANLSDTMRVELAPFGIRVVHLISGAVKSNGTTNFAVFKLPADSLYLPIKAEIEPAVTAEDVINQAMDTNAYAKRVVGDLLDSWWGTPKWIWRGRFASLTWVIWVLTTFLWRGSMDWLPSRTATLHLLDERLRNIERQKQKAT